MDLMMNTEDHNGDLLGFVKEHLELLGQQTEWVL
jgi:hypothetical protein